MTKATALVQFLDTSDVNVGNKVGLAAGTEAFGKLGPGEAHLGEVGGKSAVKEITLTLDASVGYASGDVLAATQEITDAMRANGGTGVVHSLVVLDRDDQGVAMDIMFLKTNVSVGTENAAISITDANADEVLGIVEITAGDFVDLVNSQLVTKTNVGLTVGADTGSKSLFLAALSRGAASYTSWGITAKVGLLLD